MQMYTKDQTQFLSFKPIDIYPAGGLVSFFWSWQCDIAGGSSFLNYDVPGFLSRNEPPEGNFNADSFKIRPRLNGTVDLISNS